MQTIASLRRWIPRNLAMLEDWLSGKPVIPSSCSIAVTWGGLSALGRPDPAVTDKHRTQADQL